MTQKSSLGSFYRGGNQGLSQLHNVFKGELLRANRTQSTCASYPLSLGPWGSEVAGHPREDVNHHQPSLVSHFLPDCEDEEKVGSESHCLLLTSCSAGLERPHGGQALFVQRPNNED